MHQAKLRNVSSWMLLILVAALFAASGIFKLTGQATDMFATWGYPAWFATFIGVAEIAGAIGLLIPKTTRWAVYGLSAIMAGAVYTHLANGEGPQIVRPLLFALVMWTALFLRRMAGPAVS